MDAEGTIAAARLARLDLPAPLAAEAARVLARLDAHAAEVLAAGEGPGEARSEALAPAAPVPGGPVPGGPAPALPPAPAVEDALAAIARRADLNAVTDLFATRARAAGRREGPLAGVPFLAKDLFDVAGEPTRAGGRAWTEAPAARDADAVAALEAAGAVLVGRAGMDEYAYGFSGENPHDGNVLNPHDGRRLSGGSSAGSAAAVAAGLVPLSLGSDTNGSVRVPAALCGVWGFKPSFGRLSRRGMAPFVDSLDHVGLFADHPDRLLAAWAALAGEPPPEEPPPEGRPLRVALLGGHFARFDDGEVAAAMAAARAALAPARVLDLSLAAPARAAAFLVTAAEAGALHAPTLGRRPGAYGPLVGPRLAAGAAMPARWLLAAQAVRAAWTRQLLAAFEAFDLLLAPATPVVAPLREEATATIAGEPHDARLALGLFTQPVTLAGAPVLAAPHRRPGRMPAGVQVIAAPGRDGLALLAARRLHAAGFAAAVAPGVAHAA